MNVISFTLPFYGYLLLIPYSYVIAHSAVALTVDFFPHTSPNTIHNIFVSTYSFMAFTFAALSLDSLFKDHPKSITLVAKWFPFLYSKYQASKKQNPFDLTCSVLFASTTSLTILLYYHFYISAAVLFTFSSFLILLNIFASTKEEYAAKDAKRKAEDEAWKAKKLAEDEAWKAKKLAEDEAWKIEKAERKARYKAKMAAMDVEIAERRAKADAKWEAEKAERRAKDAAKKADIAAKDAAKKADIAAKDAEWNSKEAEKKAKIAARDALRKDEHAKTVQQLKEEYIDTKRQIKENYAKGKERRLQLIAARKARVAAYSPLQKTLYYLAYILPGVIAIALFLYFFLQYKPL